MMDSPRGAQVIFLPSSCNPVTQRLVYESILRNKKAPERAIGTDLSSWGVAMWQMYMMPKSRKKLI